MTVNETLTMTFPDGFRKLSDSETAGFARVGSGPALVLKDEEKHIITNLGYKDQGRLLAMLVSEKDRIRKAEQAIAEASREYGYRLLGFGERSVGGRTGSSFQYAYQAQGVDMTAECCIVREGKAFYYLYVYVREAGREESFRCWQEILDQAQWKE